MKTAERRRGQRVVFTRGLPAQMMAIDGTWRRACQVEDISISGVRLTVLGSIQGLKLTEFFLLLSSTGLAYRRCSLVRVNGDQIGASFLTTTVKKQGLANIRQDDALAEG